METKQLIVTKAPVATRPIIQYPKVPATTAIESRIAVLFTTPGSVVTSACSAVACLP